ncbi:thiol:disulfide interchange protein [Sphingomonas spermidinifaciens]|uniref:Thiol:disulfide interchange protein n=1 Tax=Sphingomonas spermidinifaciens TaxID=1141889 RepID=A0A2A4B587_9SPHN|nr:protein-disulfide reductase DsbD domain-containing protein [Sphingomonas spermidinifaciens]PCD02908.1 thiol:disulfide interchange protein [Sphingomonas spermidinifaciens]
MRRLLAFLAACFLAAPAAAQLAAQPRHLAIELVAESDSPAPGGEVTLALASKPDPGWHGYWKNPGDAGIETTLAWTLPGGVTAGPLEYPVPHRLVIGGLMNYVYEGPFAQFVRLKLPAGLAPGTRLPIAVKADYLVCTNEICVPESAQLSTVLTVGDGSITPERRAQFDQWRRAMPKPLGSAATFAVEGGKMRIGVPWPADQAADGPYFYPLTDGAIAYAAPQTVGRAGDTLVIETQGGGKVPGEVEGVLALDNGRGFEVRAVPGAVPAAAAQAALDWRAVLVAFAGAVLGGLILNVMPCVFPILSLKALGLARAGGDERAARGEALAYSAGVIAVCLALGGILLGLRAGGATVGWAFQLQDPRVIFVLLLLVTAIAFNLAGLFELSAPGAVNRLAAGGKGGAFMTGALAAFVATPCTGPFMAAALGAALVLPTAAALTIFAGLGLGLALPFLAIGFVPALRRRLPKPGPWMATLRHILSVPMFLTALALAWVLGRQAGVDGLVLGLGAVLVAALALWWTGTRQAKGRGLAWAPAAAGIVLALGGMLLVERKPAAATEVAALGAKPFSEDALQSLRAGNKPVFAYFTADWCVTCKVNEKAAIETATVADAFERGGVEVLVGDWTDGDPALGRFIERHNRAGVPLYLWYAPGAAEPRVLPQVLTPAMLAELPTRTGVGG